MKNYFTNKQTYNQISFCHSRSPQIEEREIHTYHEILFYEDGDATFLTATFRKTLKKDTLLVIPKETYHYIDTKAPERFTRLKISFPDVPELNALTASLRDIKIIYPVTDSMLFALKKICMATKNTADANAKFTAYGAFLMLLAEVDSSGEAVVPRPREGNNIISECIDMINKNLKKDISISTISKDLNVSPSSLTHTFKKEMGISIHKYVLQKRLIRAKKLIEAGHKPTKIYFDCGYQDYSAFYKAYLNLFGHPPSSKS